jgi:hypothetical protein
MELVNNIKVNVLNSSFYVECLSNGISIKKSEELIKNFAYGILRAFINEYCYGDICCVYNMAFFNKIYVYFIETIQITYNLYDKEVKNVNYINNCKEEVSQLIQIYILNYKNLSYFYDLLFCNLVTCIDKDDLLLIFNNVIKNEFLS